MTWFRLVETLAAARPAQSPPTRFNPRPAGVLVPGSTASAVLHVLRERAGVRLRTSTIVRLTGRPAPTVRWALTALRAGGHIQSTPTGRDAAHLWWAPSAAGDEVHPPEPPQE